MDNNNQLGQGLNALIPQKNKKDVNVSDENHLANKISPLEERINQKINDTVSSFPEDLKNNANEEKNDKLANLSNAFRSDFKEEVRNEKKELEQKNAIFEKPLETSPISLKEERIFQIETEKIKPNPYQPRHLFSEESIRELADSIRQFGILEPLIVTRIEKETDKGTEVEYQLIAGERRLRAAKMIGLPTVPAIIRLSMEDQKKLELSLIENIQREDLNIINKARAFDRLIKEFGLTQQELANRLGKSREAIANTLRLLQLPLEIQKALEEGLINEGHARAILLFNNPEQRKLFYKEILAKNLSGREAMELAQRYLSLNKSENQIEKRRNVSYDPQDLEWKEKLEERLGVPVVIKKKGEKGAIEIRFFSNKEFDEILKKLISS
ncbi:MAG: ParB/RepB/Spo0J family partition protein [Minisyncoccia bacterium]